MTSRSKLLPTEGIKYAGSKLKLLPFILQLAAKVEASTVLDGFSGTTRVSQAFAKWGYQVIANDVSVWSEVFGSCYLLNKRKKEDYADLIEHLNNLRPKDGWFTEHYGGMPDGHDSSRADGLKKPWQAHNTRKLDAIREEIERLSLAPVEKAVAITSLILALDEVDSTLGHFVSYLKDWSPRSYKKMHLKVPKVFVSDQAHEVIRSDIFDAVKNISVDLAYFDPPYGSNNEKMPPLRVRYASYYHLWTSICLFDKPPLFGKRGAGQTPRTPLPLPSSRSFGATRTADFSPSKRSTNCCGLPPRGGLSFPTVPAAEPLPKN